MFFLGHQQPQHHPIHCTDITVSRAGSQLKRSLLFQSDLMSHNWNTVKQSAKKNIRQLLHKCHNLLVLCQWSPIAHNCWPTWLNTDTRASYKIKIGRRHKKENIVFTEGRGSRFYIQGLRYKVQGLKGTWA